ncbi:MAG TPA: hypothetical protein VFR15_04040 [Chloroflexia bacterium]|nr:hypothetical protein [Chloroflexia bacterium]
MEAAEAWYWISLPHATFGIAAREGRVVKAAPIAGWAMYKPLDRVLEYYTRKGARIVHLTD